MMVTMVSWLKRGAFDDDDSDTDVDDLEVFSSDPSLSHSIN